MYATVCRPLLRSNCAILARSSRVKSRRFSQFVHLVDALQRVAQHLRQLADVVDPVVGDLRQLVASGRDVHRDGIALDLARRARERARDLERQLVALQGALHHADVAARERQRRVQLVRHAGDHLAEGCHLLRLRQLLVVLFALPGLLDEDAVGAADDGEQRHEQQRQQAAHDGHRLHRHAFHRIEVGGRDLLHLRLVATGRRCDLGRGLLDLGQHRRHVGIDLEHPHHVVGAEGVHRQVARDQVAVLDDPLEGVEPVAARQVALGRAFHRALPAAVGALVLPDLGVLGRIGGDPAPVEHLDLENGGPLHGVEHLRVQHPERGQSLDLRADFGKTGFLLRRWRHPAVGAGHVGDRAAVIHRKLRHFGDEGPEVLLPQRVGEHARQRDVAAFVGGDQVAQRAFFLLLRKRQLDLPDEADLLALHVGDEECLLALEVRQCDRDGREHAHARQREIANQAETHDPVLQKLPVGPRAGTQRADGPAPATQGLCPRSLCRIAS
ncbi:MAG: hypothetical protein ACYC0T_01425 [Ramlibacter sp.]